MIKITYGNPFIKSAKKLPVELQKKLAFLIETLSVNPFQPRLRAKPLTGALTGFYSFRITREYRVIFQFIQADEIKLIKVGHRKDIYR